MPKGKLFLLILFLLVCTLGFAKGGFPPPPVPNTGPSAPGLIAPIDGGVFIGVFVALFYGVKKILQNKNKF